MVQVILLVVLWAATSAISIALTGDRKMLAGDIGSPSGAMGLFLNWKFIVAMVLAVITRLLFVYINGAVLRIPSLSVSATTVTTLITTFSYPVIIATNVVMLGERISMRQYVGTALILFGIFVVCSQGSKG